MDSKRNRQQASLAAVSPRLRTRRGAAEHSPQARASGFVQGSSGASHEEASSERASSKKTFGFLQAAPLERTSEFHELGRGRSSPQELSDPHPHHYLHHIFDAMVAPVKRLFGRPTCRETPVSFQPGHNHGYACSVTGRKLFVQAWLPKGRPKAVVFVAHGLNEHSGRYKHVAEEFTRAGYAVYSWDHHGHGRSGGFRAYVDNFDFYVHDALNHVRRVRARYPNVPCFMIGHSMGGAIAIQTARAAGDTFHGVVLSAPAVKIHPNPVLKRFAPVAAKLFPYLWASPLPGGASSRDKKAVIAKKRDPLTYKGPVKARMGYELIRVTDNISNNFHHIHFPFLVCHGTADATTDPAGSKELYQSASSRDKAIQLYRGLYHDLFHEPEKSRVMTDVIRWMDQRVARKPPPPPIESYSSIPSSLQPVAGPIVDDKLSPVETARRAASAASAFARSQNSATGRGAVVSSR